MAAMLRLLTLELLLFRCVDWDRLRAGEDGCDAPRVGGGGGCGIGAPATAPKGIRPSCCPLSSICGRCTFQLLSKKLSAALRRPTPSYNVERMKTLHFIFQMPSMHVTALCSLHGNSPMQ